MLLRPWDFQARVLEWGAIAFSSRPSTGREILTMISPQVSRPARLHCPEKWALGPRVPAGPWEEECLPHLVLYPLRHF